MTDDEWKAAAMADAQKVCELTALTTELADALAVCVELMEHYVPGNGGIAVLKAKSALKKVGR